MDINSLIEFIKLTEPKVAMDIRESLLLLCETIDGATIQLHGNVDEALKNRDYKMSHELIDRIEEISLLQTQIGSYINILEIEEAGVLSDEEVGDDALTRKDIPNYGDYAVDSEISYNLYENFTHKCPAAFGIFGAKVEARQWKDVLLLTCEILAKNNNDKFYSFVSDPAMQGKKVNYISRTGDQMRKPVKLKNHDIYIETNMSANSIRNLLVKLLKKYEIKITDYQIYLRADYTDLH
nr:MAG TPA: SeqA protein/DNA Complex-DNA complex, Recognition of hemimethylated.5A [Caudoviricetes sp.]